MKILLAYGPVGRYSDKGRQHFNWCLPSEIVNVDNFVCCSSESCGCNRAFTGVFTRNGATQACVVEVGDTTVMRIIGCSYELFRQRTGKELQRTGHSHENVYNWLLEAIQKYPENTILRVRLGSAAKDGCELIAEEN